jgi:hypothetical protein
MCHQHVSLTNHYRTVVTTFIFERVSVAAFSVGMFALVLVKF